MSLKDEVDDSFYVQQQWENNIFNEHEIQEILSQFNVNQEFRNLQLNYFGMSDPILDPQLQLPTNTTDFFQMTPLTGKDTFLGKRNFKEPESSIQTPENTIQPIPTTTSTNKRQKITEKTAVNAKEITNNKATKEGKQTRECHNMNERQRRLKINQKIQDLKELLPKNCADILTNKLAILHESVEHIQNLHRIVDHLNERNLYLEQRLIEQEKDLLIMKQQLGGDNNNTTNTNNTNNNINNNINNNTSNSNSNLTSPTSLSALLSSTTSLQYQRQLPSNSVASLNYNLLSPISSLFNR